MSIVQNVSSVTFQSLKAFSFSSFLVVARKLFVTNKQQKSVFIINLFNVTKRLIVTHVWSNLLV